MARHRIKKYSRRTRSQYKKSRAPIVLSVIAFLLLSIIVSVLFGISLARRAEEAERHDNRLDIGREEYVSGGKTVTPVEAYNFPKGSDAVSYVAQEITDLSVCIRHKDGTLDYRFEIAGRYTQDELDESAEEFSSLCRDAEAAGARVCAYMYISSFDIEDEYLRALASAYEIALIAEAAESGADDILLLGISVAEDNVAQVEDFVARAAKASGTAPLGVAVSEDVLELNSDEIYLSARLRASCDYLALDLCHLKLSDGESLGTDEDGAENASRLETILEKYAFYIKSYPMRVLFSKDEFKLYIPALRLGTEDLQIVGE